VLAGVAVEIFASRSACASISRNGRLPASGPGSAPTWIIALTGLDEAKRRVAADIRAE